MPSQDDAQPLAPFSVLFDSGEGVETALPPALAALYGRLAFPAEMGRAWVISNFVASIDGVVAYNDPVPPGKGEISASDPHDRAAMGLLRALADAVIVGAGTLRAVPRHLWTPAYIYPPLATEYAALRAALGKPPAPLNVIVSGSGAVDTALPVFQRDDIATLLLTTRDSAARLAAQALGPRAQVRAIDAADDGERGEGDAISALATLDATLTTLAALSPNGGASQPLILVEGGPRLLGGFVAEGLLDEQFLTIAPQLVGRDDQFHRPGLIEGRRLAPDHPRWARLVSARQAENFLFLRYRLTLSSV
ncbi:MAG TPA: dihydrofolate reductase family protein [Ktedonobacterales bacterium]|jgi:riboflavin biosynthesis pyrimidine reductase|nr:dihydrofolate reductase family protein [Ktedonobacterales bacterium]